MSVINQLIAILTYHLIPGKVLAADVLGAEISASSVQGGDLMINGTNGVTVNGATVTQADIEATNGVIHVIDQFILPQSCAFRVHWMLMMS